MTTAIFERLKRVDAGEHPTVVYDSVSGIWAINRLNDDRAVMLDWALKNYTALSASPWVSVKERMPKSFDEDGDRFLVFTERGEFQIHGAYLGYWPQNATHWMKLEKP